MPSVLAVCLVHQLIPDSGYNGVTAIDKRAADGAVKVTRYGLRGDVQADRKHHGGLEQALYVYGEDDAAFWAEQLGRDLPAGWFGENLRVEGIDPTQARVGERWRIGEGPGAFEIEATDPRTPCATFARWVGGPESKGWVKRFADEGRLGAYFRVLKNGSVSAGDRVEVVHVPEDAPTLLEVFRA